MNYKEILSECKSSAKNVSESLADALLKIEDEKAVVESELNEDQENEDLQSKFDELSEIDDIVTGALLSVECVISDISALI